MTTLTIFTPEITTLETQLTALQTQLDELRQAEQTATQLLSNLADSLPRFEKLGAIARIKTAVLGLFGDTDAPKFQDFMTEVPASGSAPTTEEVFDAECLPLEPKEEPAPQANRHPVRERFALSLGFEYKDCTLSFAKHHLLNNAESFMQAAHYETVTGKQFWNSVDAWLDRYSARIALKQTEPKQLTIEEAIAQAEATPPTPDFPADPSTLTDAEFNELETVLAGDTPEVEQAPTAEPVSTTEQMNYIELVQLNPTVAYQRKRDGEIVCAYLGAGNQKLANNWAELLVLWGCRAEVRSSKRLRGADIKYEVKIWGISSEQLTQVAANHTTPFQSVPAPKATRPTTEKKNALQPSPSAPNGGETNAERNDADNAAPQVSLVLGKADNIYTTYHVYVEGKEVGRVERMSVTSAWSVPGMPGIWETKEEAADDLLRAKYGLPV